MRTNLKPSHELLIYLVKADSAGDAIALGTARVVPCLLENTEGWENSEFADQTTGIITCQIWPTDAFYIERGGKFEGLVAQFARVGTPGDADWYRCTSVRPGESLVGNGADLVELQLTRIAKPEHEDA